TAVLEHCNASHAAVSSNSRVCPAPCLAHGTCATVTPCVRQATRGASASSATLTVPRSSPPTAALPAVIARRSAPAPATPTSPLRLRSHVRDDRAGVLVELHVLEDRLVAQPEQASPYPEHPPSPSTCQPSNSRKRRQET